jgi:epoxyqueuosine reductase
MDAAARSRHIQEIARSLGFDRVGVAPAAPIARTAYLDQWLARGRAGSIAYLHRNRHIRDNPAEILPGARSIVVVALNYHQPAPRIPPPSEPSDAPRGRIARYAWGRDYHDVVREKLRRLVAALRDAIDEPFDTRICVDTAPILEREIAAAAGVGWIGKNTMVLHQDVGSYFVLGELVTTLDLAPDTPATDHCGTCRRCLDACPTDAFPAPYEMDAGRCISYLTIEHRGQIPTEFHAAMGDWLYGCDICQEVCPFNTHAPKTTEPVFAVRAPAPAADLSALLHWSDEDYRRTLADSAMRRATLDMLKRNAQIVIANARRPASG